MNVLFLSYNGLLEPILPSQAIPYLKRLTSEGYKFTLLTYEKKRDIDRVGSAEIRRLKDTLKSEGMEWQYLRYHKNPPVLSTVFDLTAGALKTLALVVSRKIKMVHVRGITPGIIMIVLSRILGVKVIFDMRGLLAEEYVGGGMWKEGCLQYRLVKKAEKKLLLIADAVTVLTEKHLEYNKTLEHLAGRDIPMEVIPCCVDMLKFTPDLAEKQDMRKRLGLEDKFVLMYPGKLGSFYFVEEMVQFFKFMLKIVPESIFLVATPDDPVILKENMKKYDIPGEKVVIKTNVAFEDMPSYMRIADAGIFFINPYKKIGSSPIKMGEFLASGVPVIINPGIGDTENMVRENGVGVVVEKYDESDYESAVKKLLDLKKDEVALSRRCVDTAKKYLSVEKGVRKYAIIYNSLLHKDQ